MVSTSYERDYGPDACEMKNDAFEGIETEGKKVILMDDLLGMGGTAMAAKKLLEELGQEIVEMCFIFDVSIPAYDEVVKKNLGEMKRYAMVTLTDTNMGAPIILD